MKPHVYYTVEALFWRRKIGDKLDNWINGIDYSDALVNIKQEFRHSSPIEARKEAFSHYQSLIDVLYDGLGKEYIDDYQARVDIQYYLDSENDIELGNTTRFKITDDMINGIEVYMVVDNSLEDRIVRAKTKNKYCIHGIRYINYLDRLDKDLLESLKSLFLEHKYYEEYDLFLGNELVIKHFNKIGGGAEFFLETPFDWDRFMEAFDGHDLLKNGSL